MTTIWKFEIDVTEEQEISMPLGAKPLGVKIQHGAQWCGPVNEE